MASSETERNLRSQPTTRHTPFSAITCGAPGGEGNRLAGIGRPDPHWPNAGYVIGKETFAWARGSGRDAPIATVRSKVARPRAATAEGELPARRAYISGVPAGHIFRKICETSHTGKAGKAAQCGGYGSECRP